MDQEAALIWVTLTPWFVSTSRRTRTHQRSSHCPSSSSRAGRRIARVAARIRRGGVISRDSLRDTVPIRCLPIWSRANLFFQWVLLGLSGKLTWRIRVCWALGRNSSWSWTSKTRRACRRKRNTRPRRREIPRRGRISSSRRKALLNSSPSCPWRSSRARTCLRVKGGMMSFLIRRWVRPSLRCGCVA